MRRTSTEYLEFLQEQGYGDTFPQENARILFNAKNGILQDLIVEEFSNPLVKQILYVKYSLDIGNCLNDWNSWSLTDVLIKIFVSYKVPFELRKKILFELSKVEEWRPQLAFWIWRNFSDQA